MKFRAIGAIAAIAALSLAALGPVAAQEQEQPDQQETEADAAQEPAAQAAQQQEQPEMPSGVDAQFTLSSTGTGEWTISSSQGSGIYADPTAAMVYLRVGGRYRVNLSGIDSEVLPVELRAMNGAVLVSQRENVETPDLGDANPEVGSEGIRFTLTESLAERLTYFRAVPYPGMVGFIRVTGGAQQAAAEGDGGQAGQAGGGETGEGEAGQADGGGQANENGDAGE